MSKLDEILKKANKEIGYQEQPTNRTKYGAWYGQDGVAWCYIFLSWLLITSGMKIGKCSYVPTGYAWYKVNKKFYNKPQRGDLAFFCWNPQRIPQHIGIVDSVNADGSFYCIEGNTSPSSTTGNQSNGDGVYKKLRYPKDVLGFGRPDYNF